MVDYGRLTDDPEVRDDGGQGQLVLDLYLPVSMEMFDLCLRTCLNIQSRASIYLR